MEKFTLTLSPDYVSTWGFWEACREILQNGIDQTKLDLQSEMTFDYDIKSKSLTIGCSHCRLETNTLLLGRTTKHGKSCMIGQFGEGYKLSLLVLTRMQFGVKIYTGNQVWTPSFEYNEQFKEHVLTITIEIIEEDYDGVKFVIEEVPQDKYSEVCANWLPNTLPDTILQEEYLRGRIFVEGLFVCEISELHKGYNFAAGRLTLDRDRSLASYSDVVWESSRLNSQINDPAELLKSIKSNAPDFTHLSCFMSKDKEEDVVRLYERENPGAVPISRESDRSLYKGLKTVIVPPQLRALAHKLRSYITYDPSESPENLLADFIARRRGSLSTAAIQELEDILSIMRGEQAAPRKDASPF